MKQIVISLLFLFFAGSTFSQPVFDLGIKGGIHNSRLSANINDYNSQSIVKSHIGAFMRVGFGTVYVQPEVYFISKGGEISSSLLEAATKFDFNNVDVPVMIGVNAIEGKTANVRIMAGPVFSFVTDGDVLGDVRFTKEYFKEHYFGLQYGVGIDFWNFTLDARMEHGTNTIYQHPSLNAKNRTFMVALGYKIL